MDPDTPQREETVTQETLDLSLGIFTLRLPPSLYPDRHNPHRPDPRIFAMGGEDVRIPCRASIDHSILLPAAREFVTAASPARKGAREDGASRAIADMAASMFAGDVQPAKGA
jgi:hypothetical protein